MWAEPDGGDLLIMKARGETKEWTTRRANNIPPSGFQLSPRPGRRPMRFLRPSRALAQGPRVTFGPHCSQGSERSDYDECSCLRQPRPLCTSTARPKSGSSPSPSPSGRQGAPPSLEPGPPTLGLKIETSSRVSMAADVSKMQTVLAGGEQNRPEQDKSRRAAPKSAPKVDLFGTRCHSSYHFGFISFAAPNRPRSGSRSEA